MVCQCVLLKWGGDSFMDIIEEGNTGIEVRAIQQDLNMLGVKPTLTVDGIFGPMTKQAVTDFQTEVDLPLIDGIVGLQTWDAMQEKLSPFVIINGTIGDGLFYFILPINGQNIQFVLDTGCGLGIFFDGEVAKSLNLPVIGQEKVNGVGGEATAYLSEISFSMGNREYNNVQCTVDEDPNFSMNLFGAVKFFFNNNIDFKLIKTGDNTAQLELY